MTRPDARRRNAIALAISTVLHVLFFAFIVSYVPTPPPEPQVEVQPQEVTIMPMPEIPPPPPEVIIPPKITPRKIVVTPEPPQVPTPTPPKPEPPKPEQPKPEPPKPEPPKPAPIIAKAALAPIKSAATAKPVVPKLSPLKAPTLTAATPNLAPLAPVESPKPPAPSPQASASPSPMVSLDKLNLHKPKKEAPSNVPTLPVAGGPQAGGAPSAAEAAAAAAAAAALNGAAFEQPGSRLNGLSPYPYGVMPSGGSGLRGSLVGCANAQAVGLSSVERAHCMERFGVQIHHAPVIDGISPGKRAGFDAAAARQERDANSRGVDPIKAMGADHAMPRDSDIQAGPASAIH